MEEQEEDDDESFDWQINQEPFEEDELSIDSPKYGFANKRCSVLKRLTVTVSFVHVSKPRKYNDTQTQYI